MLRGPTEWTEHEVALLQQLVKEHAGDPQATSRVAEQFPDKTYERVRSKIRWLCRQAQNTSCGTVAEPHPIPQLLSPTQSKPVRTGLRERLDLLAGSYVGDPVDAHVQTMGDWLMVAAQIPALVETSA